MAQPTYVKIVRPDVPKPLAAAGGNAASTPANAVPAATRPRVARHAAGASLSQQPGQNLQQSALQKQTAGADPASGVSVAGNGRPSVDLGGEADFAASGTLRDGAAEGSAAVNDAEAGRDDGTGGELPSHGATATNERNAPEGETQLAKGEEQSLPADLDAETLLANYVLGVKSAILALQVYPELAQRLGHAGKVKVAFSLAADGSLIDATIVSGSGYGELDSAALDCIRAAAPFDALPEAVGRSQLRLSITLSYRLAQ